MGASALKIPALARPALFGGASSTFRAQNQPMSTELQAQVLRLLDDVLSLDGRAQAFSRGTALLGAVPELDSMAVVSLMTAMEEQLGISIDDDEIDGDVFANVGSLVDFVAAKLA